MEKAALATAGYPEKADPAQINTPVVLALLTLLTVIVQVNLLPMVLRASLNLVLVAVERAVGADGY